MAKSCVLVPSYVRLVLMPDVSFSVSLSPALALSLKVDICAQQYFTSRSLSCFTTSTHPSSFNGGQALLSLLKGSKPELAVGGSSSQTTEEAIGLLFSSVVRAHCRRQDVTSALAEVAEMEAAGGKPSPEVFLYLLDACAIARPPLLRELETVWARIEVSAGPCARERGKMGVSVRFVCQPDHKLVHYCLYL